MWFWCGQAALATGTAWAGIGSIHHHLARLLSPYALLIRSAVAAFSVWPLLAAGVACCLMCGCAGLRNAQSRRRTTTSAVSLSRGLKSSSKKVYKNKKRAIIQQRQRMRFFTLDAIFAPHQCCRRCPHLTRCSRSCGNRALPLRRRRRRYDHPCSNSLSS